MILFNVFQAHFGLKPFLTLILLTCSIGLISCLEDPVQNQEKFESKNNLDDLKPIRLGKKKGDSYKLENMQKAIDMIIDFKVKEDHNLRTTETIILEPTDLYIRFLPADEKQLDVLRNDSTLFLVDFPLDYEIEEKGDFYREEDALGDMFSWMYSVVKPDYVVPENIKYEVLSELFIPEHSPYFIDSDNPNQRQSIIPVSFFEIEYTARYLAGEISEEELEKLETPSIQNSPNSRGQQCISLGWMGKHCWWVPDPFEIKGKITVYDDLLQKQIPVESVMVFFTSGFKIKSMETDVNGNFHGGNAYTNGQYHIQWGDYHFDIRKGRYTTALLWGPYRGGEWNLQITNAADKTYAHVHQAAIDYYYKCKDLFDIRRPWTNATFKPQLKIAVIGWSGYLYETSHVTPYLDVVGAFILPDVFVYTKEGSSYKSTFNLYKTTIHELAHIAHWTMDPIGFSTYVTGAGSSRRMCESWPEGPSYAFLNWRYKVKHSFTNPAPPRQKYIDNKQWLEISKSSCYTSIVEDLMDNCNQRTYDCYYSRSRSTPDLTLPDDDVSGYTLRQIEDALLGARSWNEWKDRLRNMHNNPTEHNLDRLFNSWDNNDCKKVL